MNKKPKYLTLDYSKWRSGQDGPNKVGEGRTLLENKEGFMCCLGQFTPQLNPKVADCILDAAQPSEIQNRIPLLSIKGIWGYRDTALSNEAMRINDYKLSTPSEKIIQLRKLFKKKGYTIRVINRKNKKATL